MEWDETGSLRNVVPRKDVSLYEDDNGKISVGCICNVKLREGRKNTLHRATILGIGKFSEIAFHLLVLKWVLCGYIYIPFTSICACT